MAVEDGNLFEKHLSANTIDKIRRTCNANIRHRFIRRSRATSSGYAENQTPPIWRGTNISSTFCAKFSEQMLNASINISEACQCQHLQTVTCN